MKKPHKKDRIIFDAARRYTPTSVPVNMMTSTSRGVELDCNYGDTLTKVLIRVWRLRISYPTEDIVLHANDVKSCFRQLKHHPDVLGAFSYIIADILYLSCGLTMGSDFSPATWEGPRRLIEQVAEKLFADETLVEKHRKYLDQLLWGEHLGTGKRFVQAHETDLYKGVKNENGVPEDTPHNMFVDDDVYADVFDKIRIEKAVAAGIEAVFIVLGYPEIERRQDPISWDKLFEMIIDYTNKILGLVINTRRMTVQAPNEFIDRVANLIKTTWNPSRLAFTVKEVEMLTGQLGHIANSAPWLKHLLSHLYSSIAYALKSNQSYLICTNKHFRAQLRIAKGQSPVLDEMHRSFAQSEMARKVHNLKKKYIIPPTMKEELQIIRYALESNVIKKCTPIAHLLPDHYDCMAYGDSSLDAAGGWSIDMRFWWYLEWPEEIRLRTVRYLKDDSSGKLVGINALEYATILISYAASIHYWVIEKNMRTKNIPNPMVQIMADNISSEAWTTKGCKNSLVGRRLGRLQCAMMINSPVGITTGRIETKKNIIADKISRWKKETDTLLGFDVLLQEFPQLECCRRFHPSRELLSWILDALRSEKLADPAKLRDQLLKNPGKIASSSSA